MLIGEDVDQVVQDREVVHIGDVISKVKIYGLEESIVRSSYPKAKSPLSDEEFKKRVNNLTDNDIKRVTVLGKAERGSGHDNFLKGIIVQFDLSFTIKAWTEAERYHFLDFISSMSTMHKLNEFELDISYIEYVDDRIIQIMKELQEEYRKNPSEKNLLRLLYSNPVGMKLTAGMSTNYLQLKTIYYQRRNHGLPEWRSFCKWVESLPMMDVFLQTYKKYSM